MWRVRPRVDQLIGEATRVVVECLAVLALISCGPAAHAQTTITVNSLSDLADGSNCTLRDAINLAQGGSTLDMANCSTSGSGAPFEIIFNVTGTITLGSELPRIVVGTVLMIKGPVVLPGITIDGGGAVRLMSVNPGATLNLQYLTLSNGNGTIAGNDALGGGIFNAGELNVTNCKFSGNSVIGDPGSNQGRNGFGGALYNRGSVSVSDSTFSGNQAIGATGPPGGTGKGGGIYNHQGTLIITNSTFSMNFATSGEGAATGDAQGGAIENDLGSIDLRNTTFASNIPANCDGGVVDEGFNFDDDGTCIANLTAATSDAFRPALSE